MNNTGVEVRNGEKYIFQVEKITEPWLDGVIRANPHDGWIDAKWFGFMIWFLKRSNEAPWYGLVGTFDKASTQSFAPLEYYDEKNAFTIDIHDKDKAELYLYANDKEGRYFNNQGKLKLKITLLKNSPNKKDQH